MARGDGLRVQMSAIEGVTQGRTQRLLTPQFRFQCPPLDQFQHDHGHNFTRSQNYQGLERIRRGGKKLVSVPIRTIVVEYARFVTEENWDLESIVDLFELVSEEGWPFRLLATHKYGGKAEIDMTAVLESCTVVEQAGEQDARYVDLSFTQSDDPGVSRKSNKRSGPAKPYPFTITMDKRGGWTVPHGAKFKALSSAPLTLRLIAEMAWGMPSAALYLGQVQKPAIKDWGANSKLIDHPRFRGKGGKIVVPEPPTRTERGAIVGGPGMAAPTGLLG